MAVDLIVDAAIREAFAKGGEPYDAYVLAKRIRRFEAIYTRWRELFPSGPRTQLAPWRPEEDEVIRKWYPTVEDLRPMLPGRTHNSILNRASRLLVRRDMGAINAAREAERAKG